MRLRAGYSLIELLVVVTLLSLVALAATSLFYSSLKGGGKASVLAEVKQQGDYAITTIERSLRGSVRITACEATELTVELPDSSLLTMGSVVSGDKQILALNGIGLTSDDLHVSELHITCVPGNQKQPDKVTIQFTLQKGNPAVNRVEELYTQSFQTVVSLRNY